MNSILIAVGIGCIWGIPAAGVACLVLATIDFAGSVLIEMAKLK